MLALGGAAALAAGAVFRWYPWWALTLALASVLLCRQSLRDRFAFLSSFAALAALVLYGYVASAPPLSAALPLDIPMRFKGVVADDPVMTSSGWRMAVDVDAASTQEPVQEWSPVRGRVLLAVEGSPEEVPAVGDLAVFRASLREPTGFINPGSTYREVQAVRRGIVARGYARAGSTALFAKPAPGESPFAEFRHDLSTAIARAAPGQAGAALRSLAVGDRSGIDGETYELFRRTGTIHLLSVSGLHLAVVLLLFAFLFRSIFVRIPNFALARPVDPPARIIALIPVAGYALLCGYSSATARALALTALMCAALAMSRRVSPVSALSSTLFILLLLSPLSITDPGLQLSFAAVAGLFYLPGLMRKERKSAVKTLAQPTRWERWRSKAWSWGGATLLASVAATLATAPLATFHFGQGGWSGVIHNCLAVPVSGFVTLPLALAGVGFYPLLPGVSAILWKGSALSLEFLFVAMKSIPVLEARSFASPFYSITGLLGGYLLLVALVLWGRPLKIRMMAAAAGILLIAALPAYSALAGWFARDANLYVFDVGSGQSLAIELPGPQWIIVDGGGIPGSELDTGAEVVWPALLSLGCGRLDVAVSSHPHPDHLGGLPSLVRLGRPREVWLPEGFAGDNRYAPLIEAAKEVGAEISYIGPPTERRIGGSRLALTEGRGRSENDRSLVMEVESGGARLVIPNDVEAVEQGRLLEESGFFRKGDLFMAPHHSWGNAVNHKVWESVRPTVALVSCGDRKNLPSGPFREEAKKAGAVLLSTAADGALKATFGENGVLAGPAPR